MVVRNADAASRPQIGALTFVAADHAHADIVYIDSGGGVACAICRARLDAVRVAAAPAPKKPKPVPKQSTRELERELNAIERQLWNPTPKRAALERRAHQLEAKITAIQLRNMPPQTKPERFEAPAFQARFLWPLAIRFRAGTKLSATSLLELVREVVLADKLGRAVQKKLASSDAPVLHATIKKSGKSDDRIGGKPAWLSGEEWPACRKCNEDMQFIAQLSAGPGTGMPLRRGRRVFLFNCRDLCWGNQTRSVVVQPNRSKARRAGDTRRLLPEIALAFSAAREKAPPSDRSFRTQDALIAASLLYGAEDQLPHATKVGGHPVWIQGAVSPRCPICRKAMTFCAQIDSAMQPKLMRSGVFGDAGAGYLFMCRQHETAFFDVQSC
jgi:hypothetical protein